jgi:hypothetical protein
MRAERATDDDALGDPFQPQVEVDGPDDPGGGAGEVG